MPFISDWFSPQLAAVFLTGLLGGVHCAGMCGGVVAALSGGPLQQPPWHLQIAFNLGRIAMYALAGAAAGAVFDSAGAFTRAAGHVLPLHLALAVFANLMLAGLGLYLLGITRHFAALEHAGARVWRALRPAAQRCLPANTLPRALALGALWGWMPCGLVYSMLAIALVTGDARHGALVMLAFGLGTLPNLLLAGVLMRWINRHRAGGWMRYVGGASVLGLALFGMAHAANLDGRSLHVSLQALGGWLCLTP